MIIFMLVSQFIKSIVQTSRGTTDAIELEEHFPKQMSTESQITNGSTPYLNTIPTPLKTFSFSRK